MKMTLKVKSLIGRFGEPKFFFFFVALVLVNLWFQKNLLFGGTETGVLTYNPEKILSQIVWTWWEALGPGISYPATPTSIPLYTFMSLLQRLGFDPLFIQKILFFCVIYFQGLGIIILFKKLFPQQNKYTALLAGIFYILNAYMMIHIWHRFIFANFILSAALPALMYLYLQLLDTRKFRYIFYFLVVSFISSYMYSLLAPTIALWVAMGIFYLLNILTFQFQFKRLIQITYWSFLLIFLWTLTNLWWIYPLLNNQNIYSTFSVKNNVDTLATLSADSKISYVVRGINPYVVLREKDWGDIYETPLLQTLSWIPVALVLWLITTHTSSKKILGLAFIWLIGVFLAKGAASPLGSVIIWLYSYIFVLGVIKNPFEKLGLLIFIPFSLLLAVAISEAWREAKSNKIKVIVAFLLIGSFIYIWPMGSDKLFGSSKYPPFFQPPDDYQEVGQFLSEVVKKDAGKILQLPMTEGDATTYRWPSLYNGVELSSQLFPGVTISRFLYHPDTDFVLNQIATAFHSEDYQTQSKLVSALSVKYIILNKNLDWKFRKIDNPELILSILDSSPDLETIKDTPNLRVYKFKNNIKEIVTTPTRLALLSNGQQKFLNDANLIWKDLGNDEIWIKNMNNSPALPTYFDKEIILPQMVLFQSPDFQRTAKIGIPSLYANQLPSSPLYKLVLLKEKLDLWLTPQYDKPRKMILLTTKRLNEIKKIKEVNKTELLERAFTRYAYDLEKVLALISSTPGLSRYEERTSQLRDILDEERNYLENFNPTEVNRDTDWVIQRTRSLINDFNKKSGFELYHEFKSQESSSGDVFTYRFETPISGKREIILSVLKPEDFGFRDQTKISYLLDGVEKEIELKKYDDNKFSLGFEYLSSGLHEITLQIKRKHLLDFSSGWEVTGDVQLSKNFPGTFRIISDKSESSIKHQIPNYAPEKIYKLSFSYHLFKGTTPLVDIEQSSLDEINNIKRTSLYKISEDYYNFDWKKSEVYITYNNSSTVIKESNTQQTPYILLDRSTTNPVIHIKIPRWDNCYVTNYRHRNSCEDEVVRNKFARPTVVEINELKLDEIFNGDFLLRNQSENLSLSTPKVTYKKISPVEYQIDINNPNPNLYVVLNESFHPSWQIEVNNGKKWEGVNKENHFLANGYANGWLVNKIGQVSLRIRFTPQEYLYKGAVISMTVFMIITIFFFREIRKDRNDGEYSN